MTRTTAARLSNSNLPYRPARRAAARCRAVVSLSAKACRPAGVRKSGLTALAGPTAAPSPPPAIADVWLNKNSFIKIHHLSCYSILLLMPCLAIHGGCRREDRTADRETCLRRQRVRATAKTCDRDTCLDALAFSLGSNACTLSKP